MSEISYQRVQENLNRLKLGRIPDCLDQLAQQAAKDGWSYVEFLDHLLVAELADRHERDVAMKLKLAHFPLVKTLDNFDFGFQPSVPEKQVRELASMRFVANGENVLLLGPPGVGKTHIALGLGMAAVQQSLSVYFITVSDLLEQLTRDAREDRLGQRLAQLSKPKLLILDEMGYFPLDRVSAQFMFQLVSKRYQRGSIVLTSNKSYGEWGDIFVDQVLAVAILDRLLHHSTTINIRGQSYRLREKHKAGVFQEQTQVEKEG